MTSKIYYKAVTPIINTNVIIEILQCQTVLLAKTLDIFKKQYTKTWTK